MNTILKNPERNYAFIDGQNVHLGTATSKPTWKIDTHKFRVYLKDKYNVARAYYFIGTKQDKNNSLYQRLQERNYIVVFKPHRPRLLSQKKGNVDIDIVFEIMKKLLEEADTFSKIVLVSGDGDYKKVVDYLIKKIGLRKYFFLILKDHHFIKLCLHLIMTICITIKKE